jgi:hypothetical protein
MNEFNPPDIVGEDRRGDRGLVIRRELAVGEGERVSLIFCLIGMVVPIVAIVMSRTLVPGNDFTLYYTALFTGAGFFVGMVILGLRFQPHSQRVRIDNGRVTVTRVSRMGERAKRYEMLEFVGIAQTERREVVPGEPDNRLGTVGAALLGLLGGTLGTLLVQLGNKIEYHQVYRLVLRHREHRKSDIVLAISPDRNAATRAGMEFARVFGLPRVE